MPPNLTTTVIWKDAAWRAAIIPHLNTALTVGATVVRNEAYRALTAHQSPPTSRPGQVPHRDTGQLSESLTVASPSQLGNLHAAMGTAIHYGRTLEFGGVESHTPKSSAHEMDMGRSQRVGRRYKAARPWIVRSLMVSKGQIAKDFAVVARTELKAAGLSL